MTDQPSTPDRPLTEAEIDAQVAAYRATLAGAPTAVDPQDAPASSWHFVVEFTRANGEAGVLVLDDNVEPDVYCDDFGLIHIQVGQHTARRTEAVIHRESFVGAYCNDGTGHGPTPAPEADGDGPDDDGPDDPPGGAGVRLWPTLPVGPWGPMPVRSTPYRRDVYATFGANA